MIFLLLLLLLSPSFLLSHIDGARKVPPHPMVDEKIRCNISGVIGGAAVPCDGGGGGGGVGIGVSGRAPHGGGSGKPGQGGRSPVGGGAGGRRGGHGSGYGDCGTRGGDCNEGRGGGNPGQGAQHSGRGEGGGGNDGGDCGSRGEVCGNGRAGGANTVKEGEMAAVTVVLEMAMETMMEIVDKLGEVVDPEEVKRPEGATAAAVVETVGEE